MKNQTSGDFAVMLNSVYAAQHPHHFVYRGYEVETTGNPLTHVVLRGAVSKHGNSTQNYHYEDLIRLCDMYAKMDLVNPAAIIDANHSNSGKQFKEQIRIVKEVMHNRQLYRRGFSEDPRPYLWKIYHRSLPWMGRFQKIDL